MVEENKLITSGMKAATSATSTTKGQMWMARLQLLKEVLSESNSQIRRRIIRKIFYKFFKSFFKNYYLYQAKQNTSATDWKSFYCGEEKGLVTIVLPVYNQAHLLEESVESVLSQTYNDFELIIVNDGSTDGVESVLDKYVTHPKVLILNQQNQKLPSALNTGFARAKGEFYTWTSADNIMFANQLNKQVQYLNKNDFVHMVYCNYELMDAAGRPLKHFANAGANVVNTDQDIHSLNYTYNFINACFLYRSCVARVIGNYHPDMYGAEDYDYWMRINNYFAIQHIGQKDPYYKYRVHDETILRREGETIINETISRAQKLDEERQSFFQLPVRFYVPDDVLLKHGNKKWSSGQPPCQFNSYETCKSLDALLSNEGINTKKALFVTDTQMKNKEYQYLLERCKHDKMLFTFAIVEHDITKNEIHELEPLDWIIVATRDLYRALSDTFGNRLLCLPAWRNWTNLYIIIANFQLFYRRIGRRIFYPVPRHSVYR